LTPVDLTYSVVVVYTPYFVVRTGLVYEVCLLVSLAAHPHAAHPRFFLQLFCLSFPCECPPVSIRLLRPPQRARQDAVDDSIRSTAQPSAGNAGKIEGGKKIKRRKKKNSVSTRASRDHGLDRKTTPRISRFLGWKIMRMVENVSAHLFIDPPPSASIRIHPVPSPKMPAASEGHRQAHATLLVFGWMTD
jgi:hypothetical protein